MCCADLRRQLSSQGEARAQLERTSSSIASSHNSKLHDLRLQVLSTSHLLDQIQEQNRQQEAVIEEQRYGLGTTGFCVADISACILAQAAVVCS